MTSRRNDPPASQDYRDELYRKYVSSGQGSAPPADGVSHPYLERLIRDHLPADKQAAIVDLGCGNGQFVELCLKAGYRNTKGIDISAEQVAAAHARGLEDAVAQANLLPFLTGLPAGACQALVALDVVEHLGKTEILRFFDEAHRALAAAGRLILHVPNGVSPFVGSILYGDFTHETAFTAKSLEQVAFAAGFSRVACYEDAPIPHGVKSFMRALAWPLCRLVLRAVNAVETGAWSADVAWTRNMLVVIDR